MSWLTNAINREDSIYPSISLPTVPEVPADSEVEIWRRELRQWFKDVTTWNGASILVLGTAEYYLDSFFFNREDIFSTEISPSLYSFVTAASVASIHLALKLHGNIRNQVSLDRLIDLIPNAAFTSRDVKLIEFRMMSSMNCSLLISTAEEFAGEYLAILSRCIKSLSDRHGMDKDGVVPVQEILRCIRESSEIFLDYVQNEFAHIGVKRSTKALVGVRCAMAYWFTTVTAQNEEDMCITKKIERRSKGTSESAKQRILQWLENTHRTSDGGARKAFHGDEINSLWFMELKSSQVDISLCEVVERAVILELKDAVLRALPPIPTG